MQISQKKKRGEFVNTWSVDGFHSEGVQPAELGWGTHEKTLPADAEEIPDIDKAGNRTVIYLRRPGCETRVRTWAPHEGPFQGYLITHNESVSIPDYFSLYDKDGKLLFRPTVHYAYHPCDDAIMSMHELSGKNYKLQENQRILREEIVSGIDELGVLLMGHKKGAYWYGSQMDIEETRKIIPNQSATSIQITSSVYAGIVWAIENPKRGIVEPEQLDYERILQIATPYLGPVVGVYSDWTPLQDRGIIFPEDLDTEDPWQFKNFRA